MAQRLAAEMAVKLADTMPVRERSIARVEEAESLARRTQMELKEKEEAIRRVQDECALLRAQSRHRGASRGSKSPAPNSKIRRSRSSSRGAPRGRFCVVDPRPHISNYEVTDSEVASESEPKSNDAGCVNLSHLRQLASPCINLMQGASTCRTCVNLTHPAST